MDNLPVFAHPLAHTLHPLDIRIQRQERLPLEILSLIIQCSARDLQQLHSFLFVNRFFFETAVKLLYADHTSLIDPGQTFYYYARCLHNTDKFINFQRKMLSQHLLLSLLQYADTDPYATLRRHGLEPLTPFPDKFLANCPPHNGQSDQSDQIKETAYDDQLLFPRLSINYLRFLWTNSNRILYIDWSRVLKEIHPPVAGSPEITKKTHMLFLTQNAVNIRRLELKIDEFSDLVDLGLHLKMSSLRALNVKFSNVSLHQRRSCENALQSFIRGNQNAFPSKRPLRLELDRELDTKFWTNATQYQKDGPESQGGCLEGRLGLYSSLESPCAMDASFIPWFYERFSNSSIDTSRLWWFKDAKDRPVLLEKNGTTKGSAKAVATKTLAFLMQCPQLRELLLCVSHVDQFRLDMLSSHKCQETGDTMEGAKAPRAQLHIPRCPQLSKLNLRTALHTRILLGALNDAVALFRDSLRELGACAGDGYQEYIYEGSGMLPYPTAEFGPNPAVVEFSRRCNTIGYWDAPFLRKIHLMVQGAHYLDVGAFDGCPQLEELYLSSDGRQTTLLAKGSDDKSLDTPPWLDPFKRFPKWTLPRLRALKVVGEIALQFNYGSFIDGMPNLVSAEITDWSPRDPKAKLEDDTWPKRWNLPRLRKLDLVGPMACVFSWGRLLDLPMLKDLNLQYTNPPASRIRKTVIDADSTIPGSITGDDHHQFIWDNKIEGILCKGMPFFKSRLQKIDILGESAMTQDEFVDLMTVYAPNFKDIIVDEISDPEYKMNMSGYLDGITRALNCLDSKNYLELAEKAADMPTTGPEVFYTVEELRGYFLEHAAFGFDEEDLERQKLFSHLSLWPPRTGSRTVRLKLYRSVTDDEARIVDDYCYEISRHEDHSNPPDISVYLHNECLFNLADLE